jgi:hypothetical protein
MSDGATLVLTEQDFHPDDPFAEFTKLDEKMGRALSASCEAAGIAYDTWFVWRHRHPQFAKMVDRVRVLALPEVEDSLFRAAIAGNVEAAKTIMKAHSMKYRERQVIEVVSPDVQQRLARQADTMLQILQMELEPGIAAKLAVKLAEALREIWS